MNALYDERMHRMMRMIEGKADKEALKALQDWLKVEAKRLQTSIDKSSEEIGMRIIGVEEGLKKMVGEVVTGQMLMVGGGPNNIGINMPITKQVNLNKVATTVA